MTEQTKCTYAELVRKWADGREEHLALSPNDIDNIQLSLALSPYPGCMEGKEPPRPNKVYYVHKFGHPARFGCANAACPNILEMASWYHGGKLYCEKCAPLSAVLLVTPQNLEDMQQLLGSEGCHILDGVAGAARATAPRPMTEERLKKARDLKVNLENRQQELKDMKTSTGAAVVKVGATDQFTCVHIPGNLGERIRLDAIAHLEAEVARLQKEFEEA